MRAILTCYSDDNSDFVINDFLCVQTYIEKHDYETFILLKDYPPPDLKFPRTSFILINKENYINVFTTLCKTDLPTKLFLYFSCHSSSRGIVIENEYFRIGDIIKNVSKTSNVEIFCVFDCCEAKSLLAAPDNKKLLVFYSCDENQRCSVVRINKKSYSLFTKVLFKELAEGNTPLPKIIEKINYKIARIKNQLNVRKQTASSNHKSFLNWLL